MYCILYVRWIMKKHRVCANCAKYKYLRALDSPSKYDQHRCMVYSNVLRAVSWCPEKCMYFVVDKVILGAPPLLLAPLPVRIIRSIRIVRITTHTVKWRLNVHLVIFVSLILIAWSISIIHVVIPCSTFICTILRIYHDISVDADFFLKVILMR